MTDSTTKRNLAVVLLSALVAAFAAGWVWQVAVASRDQATVAFNQAMTNHHAQAVTIALILHERSEDPDLRAVSRDVILTQQAQIGAMGAHLDQLGAPRAGVGHRMVGMASPADLSALQTLPSDAATRLGLKLLTAHHQGGVLMASEALTEGIDRPSARLAESIVAAQNSEIQLLKLIAERLNATP
jgi:uncharacterized protein (DUF305 family)